MSSSINILKSLIGRMSVPGRTAFFAMLFLLLGGVIVIASHPPFLEMGSGVGPASAKTVTKTIVVEYNIGNYNSADGTQNPDGSGTTYEKQYTLSIPDEAQNAIGTTLQLSTDGSGSCDANFATFICGQSADSMTVMVTRIDMDAAWEDNLILKAVNYME